MSSPLLRDDPDRNADRLVCLADALDDAPTLHRRMAALLP